MTAAALTFAPDANATYAAPRLLPGLERRLLKLRRHRLRMAAADAAIIIASGGATSALLLMGATGMTARTEIIGVTVVLVITWITTLAILRGHDVRRGAGRRLQLGPVLHSTALSFAVLAIVTAVTESPGLRAHVLITLPAAVVALFTLRLLRVMLYSPRRESGRAFAPRTLVIGRRADIEQAIRSLARQGGFGFNVVGAAVSDDPANELTVDGRVYPVLGQPADAAVIARSIEADTVVAATATDDPDHVRRLSWSLEGAATDLVLATRLTDVAPSRVSFHRADGLALTHVSLPRFDDETRRAKRILDVIVAGLALMPIALITPFIALFIAMDSPGGVFFRQRRIGRDGRQFDILKFRTMSATAEADRALLEAQNEGSGPLFKLKQDPRVTRVGRVLRRFSLDELPQFWNVLRGEMSVVGPRPPLPSEVADYGTPVFRRLYVQPGITGLWQISGRSDLSWDESVRLDLHYVENWSVATDLQIMGRTAAVMVRPKGAY